ncbi:hypothetical protein C0J52_03670 [Blattella germanica]|nr:hypothetical protein C0J52_03670 [Blattella germanica]
MEERIEGKFGSEFRDLVTGSSCKMLNLNMEQQATLKNIKKESFDRNKMDEMTSLIMEIEQSHTRYLKNKLVLKAIKRTMYENKDLLPQIAPKSQQIIAAESISCYMNLKVEGKEHLTWSILGLNDYYKDNSIVTLTYGEKVKLSDFVKNNLVKTCSKIRRFELVPGSEVTFKARSSNNICSSEKIKFLKSTESQFLKMYESLSVYRNLCKELSEMRLGLHTIVRSEMIPWFEMRCEHLELEANILERRILVHMYSENPSLPEAVQQVIGASKKEHENIKEELKRLRRDEQAYAALKGNRKFEEVLEEYKSYRCKLEDLNWLLSEF